MHTAVLFYYTDASVFEFVDVGAVVHRGQCVVVFDDSCWSAFCFNMQSISTIDSYDATLLQPALLSLIQRH